MSDTPKDRLALLREQHERLKLAWNTALADRTPLHGLARQLVQVRAEIMRLEQEISDTP